MIVTANLRHFPPSVLRQFRIEPRHPDEFILSLLDLAPELVVAAARDHRESLKNPAKAIGPYLDALEAQGLRQTVSVLRQHMPEA